jgi:acetyl-CoA carboxylase carboxyltransferase component
VTGAALTVPLVAVILRKAYGLGAQAMAGGSLHEPLLTVGWPTAELGPMGLEGAVKLGFRRELDQIPNPEDREKRVTELTDLAHERVKALNAATLFELDDVTDPAETRRLISSTLAAATEYEDRPRPGRRFVDAW